MLEMPSSVQDVLEIKHGNSPRLPPRTPVSKPEACPSTPASRTRADHFITADRKKTSECLGGYCAVLTMIQNAERPMAPDLGRASEARATQPLGSSIPGWEKQSYACPTGVDQDASPCLEEELRGASKEDGGRASVLSVFAC